MADTYEVEIKSLLGSKKKSDELLEKLSKADSNFVQFDTQEQLNHYFIGKPKITLYQNLKSIISDDDIIQFKKIIDRSKKLSIRTRQKNGEVLLIVKSSNDGSSAVHGHKRLEHESLANCSIDVLDRLLSDNGLQIQAKWSASRKMYKFRHITVDMMFSPGYGYVVEFEKVIAKDKDPEEVRQEIISIMKEFKIEELDTYRLERMFEYYNNHWQEYYGTKKIFNVA